RRNWIPSGLVVPLDLWQRLHDVLAGLSEDERDHFIPKGQCAEVGELAWYFRGRTAERKRIADWLRTPARGLPVVTGPPGLGKSALLGNVVTLSHAVLRDLLIEANQLDRLSDVDLPPDEVFDGVLHLAGVTPAALVDELAALAKVDAPSRAAPLSTRIGELLETLSELTLVVDALDEAEQPLVIARDILR